MHYRLGYLVNPYRPPSYAIAHIDMGYTLSISCSIVQIPKDSIDFILFVSL